MLSNTVLGVYEGERLLHHWRVWTDREKTSDEYGILLRNLYDASHFSSREIQAIIISSVVPPLTPTIVDLCERYFGGAGQPISGAPLSVADQFPAIAAAPPLKAKAPFRDVSAVREFPAIDSRAPASIVRQRRRNLRICHASNPFHDRMPMPKGQSGIRQGRNIRRSIHPKHTRVKYLMVRLGPKRRKEKESSGSAVAERSKKRP